MKIANVGKQQAQWADVSYLPKSYATDFKEYILREGDVVMALTRPILDNELKVAKLTKHDVPSLLNQRVAKVIPRSGADLNFIYYVLQTRHFVDSMNDAMAGTDPPNIGSKALGRIPIATPPVVEEQRAIAGSLSDVDALLGALNWLIAKKRDLKQAAMQQLLTGQTRLPGFHNEWEMKRLGEVVQITKGQLITEKDAIHGPVPVIAGGMKPAYFHNKPNRTGKTITVSASGASAGYVAFFDTPIFASDCSTISGGNGYSIEFVYFQLQLKQEAIYKAQTGGAQPHIHAVDLIPLEVGWTILSEQTSIAEVLTNMDAELAALERRRDKTRALRQGMMQELLTGRTRLV